MTEPVSGQEYETRFAWFMETVLSGDCPETESCCAICLTDSFQAVYHTDADIRRAGVSTGGVLCEPCYDKYVDAFNAHVDARNFSS